MKFVSAIRSAWRACKAGISHYFEARYVLGWKLLATAPEGNKPPQSDAGPNSISKDSQRFSETDDRLPLGIPGSYELRVLADYLNFLTPAEDALALVRARDYTAAHELAGFHEALTAIRGIADQVDKANDVEGTP